MRASIRMVLVVFLLGGCATFHTPNPIIEPDVAKQVENRQIVVFFDGTENAPSSRTNVIKLWDMLSTDDRTDLMKFYIEGVGADGKKVGSGTGWGTGYRVRKAYAFLLEHYSPGDNIHIVGFSRGAYSARILASILYSAGLPSVADDMNYETMSAVVFDAFKGEMTPTERRERINHLLTEKGLNTASTVQVTTLAIWDAVETLGIVDTWEAFLAKLGFDRAINVGERNSRYGDQLCNVELALHAMSIDDNRAHAFTPKLLKLPHLFENCRDAKSVSITDFESVEEVWFSGAHADVGGGYDDEIGKSSCLSNISLAWMVERLASQRRELGLKPAELQVDVTCSTHNAHDDSFFNQAIYREEHRKVPGVSKESGLVDGLRHAIHCSVIERLARKKIQPHEYQWIDERARCFKGRGDFLDYRGSGNATHACTDPSLNIAFSGCPFNIVN